MDEEFETAQPQIEGLTTMELMVQVRHTGRMLSNFRIGLGGGSETKGGCGSRRDGAEGGAARVAFPHAVLATGHQNKNENDDLGLDRLGGHHRRQGRDGGRRQQGRDSGA
jgi:hypothetical protein